MLGSTLPGRATGATAEPAGGAASAPEEFWRRFEPSCALALGAWPPAVRPAGRDARAGRPAAGLGVGDDRRARVQRRAACSPCAPTRSGGASWSSAPRARRASAAASSRSSPARLADAEVAAAEARVTAAGAGVVLADWAALARDPGLAGRFAHVVVVDPPPFAHLERLCAARRAASCTGSTGEPRREFALRVHADEWPSRCSLAALYRALDRAPARRLRRARRPGAALRRASVPIRSRPRSPPARPGCWASSSSCDWDGYGPDRSPRRRILVGDGSRALRGVRRLP